MLEQWKPVTGYEEKYEISNLGNVRTAAGRLLKPTNIGGYLSISLTKNKKARLFRVHRLVATAFIPNPSELPVVNHKDENRLNNSADNLEWCTQSYNYTYGNARKRWHDSVYNCSINISHNGEEKRVGEWADLLKCSKTTVYNHYRKGQEHFDNWLQSRLKLK